MSPFSFLGLSTASKTALPYPSALSTLIANHQEGRQRTTPETQSSKTNPIILHPPHLHALALTVLHNLQYQHDWTELQIHIVSPLRALPFKTEAVLDQGEIAQPLPRPLVSGVPPQRLYLHPDDQLALIAADKSKKRRHSSKDRPQQPSSDGGAGVNEQASQGAVVEEGAKGSADAEEPHIARLRVPRREWVLPTQLREKWSLRKFAEVFDGIGLEPPSTEDGVGGVTEGDGKPDGQSGKRGAGDAKANKGSAQGEASEVGAEGGMDRYEGTQKEVKRVLLATVSDDSTVVYYIVHDGIVKPRQN